MSKVTIIVPTYNVEDYIRKCLESLVHQTSQEYEVLVINDGSPANEQPIIDEYVKQYSFVHTIVKENGGYGSVLALAIQTITTPYMMICDPDDYLYPHTVETLIRYMENSQADLVIGAKTLVYSDNEEETYDKSYNESCAQLIDQTVYQKGTTDYNQLFFVEPSPHAKLYKTTFLKQLSFPPKVAYTDNILYFGTLIRTEKVFYTSEPLAYYLINRVGNTRTDVKLGVINSWIKVITSLLQQAQNVDQVPDIFYYRMFEAYKHVFNNKLNHVIATDDEYRQKLNECYEIIRLLLPYQDKVMVYYKKMNEYRFLEQMKDQALLNPKTSERTYHKLAEKKLRERAQ